MKVLKTITYFSLFKYPLNKREIFEFTNISSKEELETEINHLLNKKIIYKFDEFYTTVNDYEIIKRRKLGNIEAKKIMPKALRVSKFISKFPYVESVCLSGALSKGYFDKEGDFDFFIITKSNRLWIARTFLILYKKIFLLNSKKYFCVNYFVSTDGLEIAEKNLFTATEIATLIPLYGKNAFKAFLEKNTWSKPYFPNKPEQKLNTINDSKKTNFSIWIQKSFDGNLGLKLDNLLQKITIKRWINKFNHLPEEEFKIAMKSTRNVSKHHPQNYQNKVIKRLNVSLTEAKQKHQLNYLKNHA